jgi:quinoprotein glucose dehydrogenase
LIAPVNRYPAVIRLIPREEFSKEKKAHPETEITEQDGTPYSMSREFFSLPSGMPCTAPPYGELVAVSPDTGKIEWRVPLGEMQASGVTTSGLPNLGGPASTGTGLVFIGASADKHIRAFETTQGRVVWTGDLPTGARATPLVFTDRGRQLVAIAAGGFDNPLSTLDTKLIVFALPNK